MKVQVAAPVIISLVYRAYSHDSLTPLGIGAAAVTAIVHALHPWNVFFVLLVVFFLAGTAVTKVCCVQFNIELIVLILECRSRKSLKQRSRTRALVCQAAKVRGHISRC